MPKTSSSVIKRNDSVRGRLLGYCTLVLSLVFMVAVSNNIHTMLGNGVTVASSANFVAPVFALVAAGISFSWERRLRLVVAISLGILVASFVIWMMAHGYSI